MSSDKPGDKPGEVKKPPSIFVLPVTPANKALRDASS